MDSSLSKRRIITCDIVEHFKIAHTTLQDLAGDDQDSDKPISEFIKFEQDRVQIACDRAGSSRRLSKASFANVYSWIIDGAAVGSTDSRERLRCLARLLHKAATVPKCEGLLRLSTMLCSG
jgi:hypothetical protein